MDVSHLLIHMQDLKYILNNTVKNLLNMKEVLVWTQSIFHCFGFLLGNNSSLPQVMPVIIIHYSIILILYS